MAWYKAKTFKEIKDVVDRFGKDFIRGFYESEGTLQIRGNSLRIKIYNSQNKILEYIRSRLFADDINCSLTNTKRENRLREYSLNILGGRQGSLKFLSLIQPCVKGFNKCG